MYEAIDRYVDSLIRRSTPEQTAWNIEKIRQGKATDWNYIDGCMMTALLNLAEVSRRRDYADFVDRFISHFVEDNGTVRTFRGEKHCLDDINEGRVLFPLYLTTGREKYKKAAAYLQGWLMQQPRTAEGSWWHKEIYPNQVWLDGIYMAQPFEALYQKTFGERDYTDITRQILLVRDRMRDPETGLYFHGYDASRKAFWCDPATGRSRSFWLRAIGWFSVALADLSEILPEGEDRRQITSVFVQLMEDMARFRDPRSGMFWQVVDQGGRPGNYPESSGSAMIAYAMLKGARLGVLPEKYRGIGKQVFDSIVQSCLTTTDDGDVCLGSICLVAGLGPEDNRRRDGTFEYYISEPVVSNDAKGVAPFLLAYSEVIRPV
ncbi:MAG: glycoside hydrolase family 88 protein [Clostridia bacterium]|nr:glycoside hydrolase family 88 protein [Clostridia bacterium]